MMKVVKIEGFWTVLGTRKDGTNFDYRFSTKKEAERWIKETE